MRTLWKYITTRYRVIILMLAVFAVYIGIFSLYGIPCESVIYASLIVISIFILTGILDFFLFFRKHETLSSLKNVVDVSVDALPSARGTLERDYDALVRALYRELVAKESESMREKEEMSDYYTLWAHQIKTPIAAMHLLLDTNDEHDRALSSQLFKTEQYVEMVMAYLRTGSDSTDFILRTYRLSDIVRETLRRYAPIFIRKKLTLNFGETDTRVLTDEKWLGFCIGQVLSNSLKYTDSGSVKVYERDGILYISDTGIGIQPEDLPRVFEKGFTGYNGRVDKRASGIGLFLTKKMLNKLGHGIGIESIRGKGTTVRINLNREKLDIE